MMASTIVRPSFPVPPATAMTDISTAGYLLLEDDAWCNRSVLMCFLIWLSIAPGDSFYTAQDHEHAWQAASEPHYILNDQAYLGTHDICKQIVSSRCS